MISKCPECGRSYPTHHGKICKLCAAKTSSPPAAAVSSNSPEKKEIQPATQARPQNTAPAPVQDFDFNPFAGGVTASNVQPEKNSQAGGNNGQESDSKPRVCPYCEYENDPTDVFCRGCEKMIIKSSEGTKLKDYPLSDLKGTIPDQLAKLKKIGITTTLQLLDKGSSPTKRKTLAIKTGISETFLLRMIQQTDLLRINSIQPDQTFILENIGINSLKMLERKNAKEIVDLMMKQRTILQSKKIMVLPGEKVVHQWLNELKKLDKVVK